MENVDTLSEVEFYILVHYYALLPHSCAYTFQLVLNFLPPGIPTDPYPLNATSPGPGEVILSVRVREAGIGSPPNSLEFDVQVFDENGTFVFNKTVRVDDYMDNTTVTLMIRDARLVAGEMYFFSVRVSNEFGSSEYVDSPNAVTVRGEFTCWYVAQCKNQ